MLFTELGAAKRAAKALRDVLRGNRERFGESVARVLELRSRLRGPRGD